MKDEEEILDAWQRRTDRVSAGVFDRYFLDGNTRRLSALRRLEDAFDKVRREVRGTTVGDVPAVWMLYNMGVVVKTREAVFSIDLHHRRVRPKRLAFGHLWELGHKSGRLTAPLLRNALAAARRAGADPVLALWGDRLS